MKIRINSIDYSGSIVDGPGIRTVLFVQGCTQRCQDCHNPSTWDLDGGELREISDVVDDIRANSINKKITISGGEPLLQEKAILKLIKILEDFDIALYTHFDLKDVPKAIIDNLDYIKVGIYIKEKKSTTLPYIGSSNQKFIDLGGIK